jgi:hypothetical protein
MRRLLVLLILISPRVGTAHQLGFTHNLFIDFPGSSAVKTAASDAKSAYAD